MATRAKARRPKAEDVPKPPPETAQARLERLAGELREHWRVVVRRMAPAAYVAETWRLWSEAADALAELGGVATLADGREVALAEHPWSICWEPPIEGRTPGEAVVWRTYWTVAKARARRLAEGRAPR
jgi:hypothetical protein